MNYSNLHNKIIEIVAGGLHFYENEDCGNMSLKTCEEITDAIDGWKKRYFDDALFNAKVTKISTLIMQTVKKEFENPTEINLTS